MGEMSLWSVLSTIILYENQLYDVIIEIKENFTVIKNKVISISLCFFK